MISDIDLRDWERSEEAVKLYDAPRDSVVSVVGDDKWKLLFDHVDGAYSFCTDIVSREIVHLVAWTDVYVWRKKYV